MQEGLRSARPVLDPRLPTAAAVPKGKSGASRVTRHEGRIDCLLVVTGGHGVGFEAGYACT